jgi:hypothetical protein
MKPVVISAMNQPNTVVMHQLKVELNRVNEDSRITPPAKLNPAFTGSSLPTSMLSSISRDPIIKKAPARSRDVQIGGFHRDSMKIV